MKTPLSFIALACAFILAACSSIAPPIPNVAAPATLQPASTSTVEVQVPAANDSARVDQQGAVVIEVRPLNLDHPGDDLDFDVAMNTHSIDLGMDLAALASLATDQGITVRAVRWDGPRGGHHVNGKLSFPASLDGRSILDGAHSLTLTIVGVDAPARVFTWPIN